MLLEFPRKKILLKKKKKTTLLRWKRKKSFSNYYKPKLENTPRNIKQELIKRYDIILIQNLLKNRDKKPDTDISFESNLLKSGHLTRALKVFHTFEKDAKISMGKRFIISFSELLISKTMPVTMPKIKQFSKKKYSSAKLLSGTKSIKLFLVKLPKFAKIRFLRSTPNSLLEQYFNFYKYSTGALYDSYSISQNEVLDAFGRKKRKTNVAFRRA